MRAERLAYRKGKEAAGDVETGGDLPEFWDVEEPDNPETATPRPACRVDADDPWTWAITPAMVCELDDMPPMTNEECAAAARLLDDLRILHAKHRTRQHRPSDSAQQAGAHPSTAPHDKAA